MSKEDCEETFGRVVLAINSSETGVDGILGFSQGGYATYNFFSCLERGLFEGTLDSAKAPYFAILVNSMPKEGFHQNSVPSLHFLGELDTAFTAPHLMLTKFKLPKFLLFPEAHKLPEPTLKVRNSLRDFLNS